MSLSANKQSRTLKVFSWNVIEGTFALGTLTIDGGGDDGLADRSLIPLETKERRLERKQWNEGWFRGLKGVYRFLPFITLDSVGKLHAVWEQNI